MRASLEVKPPQGLVDEAEVGGPALVDVAAVSMPQDGRPLAAFTLLGWAGGAWSVRQCRVPYDAGDEARALAASGIPEG